MRLPVIPKNLRPRLIEAGREQAKRLMSVSLGTESAIAAVYYDGPLAMWRLWKLTKEPVFKNAYDWACGIYLHYLEGSDYKVPGYRLYPDGLQWYHDKPRVANVLKEVALRGLWTRPTTPLKDTQNIEYSRDAALAAYWIHCALASASEMAIKECLELRERRRVLRSHCVGHCDAWRAGAPFNPFMVALTVRTLPRDNVYDKLIADLLWTKWDPDAQGFIHEFENTTPAPAPDLNMLIAPVFLRAGQRSRLRAIRKGAGLAYLGTGKHLNQQLLW